MDPVFSFLEGLIRIFIRSIYTRIPVPHKKDKIRSGKTIKLFYYRSSKTELHFRFHFKTASCAGYTHLRFRAPNVMQYKGRTTNQLGRFSITFRGFFQTFNGGLNCRNSERAKKTVISTYIIFNNYWLFDT